MKINKIIHYYLDGSIENNEGPISNPNKKLHRLDGPAIERNYGEFKSYSYYVYGVYLGYNLSNQEFEDRKNKKLKELIFG